MRKLLLFLTLAITSMSTQAQGLPKEVVRLVAAVISIPGVAEAEFEKTYLPEIKVSNLALGPYADLPIATLRRSNGALSEELLLSINFRIHSNKAGLEALEFISWWVRDESRGGENMQIRSIGLPPSIGKNKQLGTTLRFTVDWFYSNPSQDIALVLKAVNEQAKSLEQSIAIYKPDFSSIK